MIDGHTVGQFGAEFELLLEQRPVFRAAFAYGFVTLAESSDALGSRHGCCGELFLLARIGRQQQHDKREPERNSNQEHLPTPCRVAATPCGPRVLPTGNEFIVNSALPEAVACRPGPSSRAEINVSLTQSLNHGVSHYGSVRVVDCDHDARAGSVGVGGILADSVGCIRQSSPSAGRSAARRLDPCPNSIDRGARRSARRAAGAPTAAGDRIDRQGRSQRAQGGITAPVSYATCLVAAEP